MFFNEFSKIFDGGFFTRLVLGSLRDHGADPGLTSVKPRDSHDAERNYFLRLSILLFIQLLFHAFNNARLS